MCDIIPTWSRSEKKNNNNIESNPPLTQPPPSFSSSTPVLFRLSGKPLDARRISSLSCPPTPNLDEVFEEAMHRVRQRARGAMAPVACVQAVRAAATLPYEQGMQREAELMATLFTSGQARALQYCFFAQRAVAKWSTPGGARWDTSKPRAVRSAAVIGRSRTSLGCHAPLRWSPRSLEFDRGLVAAIPISKTSV